MLGSSLLRGLSLTVVGGGSSSWWLLLLRGTRSRARELQELWLRDLVASWHVGSNPRLLHWAGGLFTIEPPGKPSLFSSWIIMDKVLIFTSVQFTCSVVSDFATPWTAACQASLPITSSWSLLKRMSIKSVRPSSHLILCRPLLFLPPISPSIRVFLSESALHIRWPKYWSFSFSISPSNEYSGLISFRMDWLDFLAVQGTHESSPTPQFKNINSSTLSFHYNPARTSIPDHWKDRSLD